MSTILAVTTSIALLLNLFLGVKDRGDESIAVAIWKFLSYYTTLTNIVVCVWAYMLAFSNFEVVNDSNLGAAITFYIVSVGAANYLIFGLPKLSPFYLLAELSVHAITPLLTFIVWVVFVSKENLSYSLLPYWLFYPLGYALYTGLHGVWTKFYPYPFTNVQELGIPKVAFNVLGLSICVLMGGLLFVTLGKVLAGDLP